MIETPKQKYLKCVQKEQIRHNLQLSWLKYMLKLQQETCQHNWIKYNDLDNSCLVCSLCDVQINGESEK